jgi:hypothetical protein
MHKLYVVGFITILIVLLFIWSGVADTQSYNTLRGPAQAFLKKTYNLYNVGTAGAELSDTDISCNEQSGGLGQSEGVLCSTTNYSKTSYASNDSAQDEASYKQFYKDLLKMGWSAQNGNPTNNAPCIHPNGVGADLQDFGSHYEICATKKLSHNVLCALKSKFSKVSASSSSRYNQVPGYTELNMHCQYPVPFLWSKGGYALSH